jgi:hypothetical protein
MLGERLIEIVGTIGKKAIYHTNGMSFPVTVQNVKVAYGKVYYYITNGVGEGKWTNEDVLDVMTSEKTHAVFSVAKEFVKEWIMP